METNFSYKQAKATVGTQVKSVSVKEKHKNLTGKLI